MLRVLNQIQICSEASEKIWLSHAHLCCRALLKLGVARWPHGLRSADENKMTTTRKICAFFFTGLDRSRLTNLDRSRLEKNATIIAFFKFFFAFCFVVNFSVLQYWYNWCVKLLYCCKWCHGKVCLVFLLVHFISYHTLCFHIIAHYILFWTGFPWHQDYLWNFVGYGLAKSWKLELKFLESQPLLPIFNSSTLCQTRKLWSWKSDRIVWYNKSG